MLMTWRAGTLNGRALFDVVPQLAIKQDVFGTGAFLQQSIGFSPRNTWARDVGHDCDENRSAGWIGPQI